MVLDIEGIFEKDVFPITKYVVIQKRRGRKKKVQEENPNKDIKNGSIIQIKLKDRYKGVLLKKASEDAGLFFRNSMTFVMIIDNKIINFKVSRNGKFQMTGCKTDDQAENCIKYFWSYIKDYHSIYSFSKGKNLQTYYEPVMYNIDFSLGFQIIRENLDHYINVKTPYTSLLETTAGYTGVNIKMPVKTDYSKLQIKKIEFIETSTSTSYINYEAFMKKFNPSKIKKTKYNTFLVFQSGKIIMSGKAAVFMEESYYEFIDIIKKCTPFICEIIED